MIKVETKKNKIKKRKRERKKERKLPYDKTDSLYNEHI